MDNLEQLRQETNAALDAAQDLRAWDAVRVSTMGKSGRLTGLLKQLGQLSPDERKAQGAALNVLRDELNGVIEARRLILEKQALDARLVEERIDVSIPPRPVQAGGIHPISRTFDEMYALFGAMGFTVAEGPDIESDWHNFSALNIPPHHPARASFDTFYLPPLENAPEGPARVLRTHTSPVQIRAMLEQGAPLRIIAPGRTYRSDHDATHSPMFHQIEGLVIGKDITLGHLKGCLTDFLRAFFGIDTLKVRFRSSYFPFTEPSMEVDIGWDRKSGALGAGDDWLEVLGSGMVHPNVLANCGIDPTEWQGFAFGMGIERLTMLKLGIPDLRSFYESDVRWLRHYAASPLLVAGLHEQA